MKKYEAFFGLIGKKKPDIKRPVVKPIELSKDLVIPFNKLKFTILGEYKRISNRGAGENKDFKKSNENIELNGIVCFIPTYFKDNTHTITQSYLRCDRIELQYLYNNKNPEVMIDYNLYDNPLDNHNYFSIRSNFDTEYTKCLKIGISKGAVIKTGQNEIGVVSRIIPTIFANSSYSLSEGSAMLMIEIKSKEGVIYRPISDVKNRSEDIGTKIKISDEIIDSVDDYLLNLVESKLVSYSLTKEKGKVDEDIYKLHINILNASQSLDIFSEVFRGIKIFKDRINKIDNLDVSVEYISNGFIQLKIFNDLSKY